ncbi:MAG TPA: lytic transglycosylase domain-containing protein [Trebonia sp.]|nr:lytic transglycosylase domain-containing protein [Trebonia sp.]
MSRHLSLPSFLSSKRSKVTAVASAGTLAVAIAAGAAAATLPSGTAAGPASAADAYLAVVHGHQGTTAQADAMSAAQLVIGGERARFGLQHSENVAAAKAAAAKAAAAKAAAAKAAAATKAAALAARQAAAKQSAAKQATARRSAAQPTQTVATQQAAEPSGSPQQVAKQMLGQFGWSGSQFSCLEPLWERESGWDVTAENPSSGAYGIPQALSGSLMASAGPDWQTDAATQIRWGLTYIQGRYGSPCGAWAHEESDGWY